MVYHNFTFRHSFNEYKNDITIGYVSATFAIDTMANVRELTFDDEDQLISLQYKVFGCDMLPEYRPGVWIMLGEFLSSGLLVSAIAIRIHDDTTAELVMLGTLLRYRRKGSASRLLETAKIRLNNNLIVFEYLSSAKTWYFNRGFVLNDDGILELDCFTSDSER